MDSRHTERITAPSLQAVFATHDSSFLHAAVPSIDRRSIATDRQKAYFLEYEIGNLILRAIVDKGYSGQTSAMPGHGWSG
jgi:hypothetical protein